MTLLEPQRGAIPLPYPSPISRPFWEGQARGELLFQRCADCGRSTHTPALVCAHCGSQELGWVPSTGRGTVYSWTIVWRPQTPEFTVPYVPIIVDLEEGWQMLSNLVGCEHDAVHVGQPVEVVFHPHPGGVTMPYFQPRPVADG
ncbi:MAG: Zn-ribbon domain-containing OB-fold protein [Acidimicrobiales bacterium]